MNPTEIVMERLHNQQLTYTKFQKPVEIISWLGAVQGQDYSGAKWAVGLRLPGSTDAELEQAIAEKTIFRTWLMRGTLHLVATEDICWMLELLASRIIKSNARRYRELALDEKTLNYSNQVLRNALEKGKELNRRELLAILQGNGISTEGQRAAYILQRASLEGLICQCTVDHNNPTYMLMDSIPKNKSMEREEALAELARRYFKSRGPATIGDFIWWSGLLAADARAGLEAVKSEFIQETVDNRIYWHYETYISEKDISSITHLLPTYDEYLFGYKDRSASLNVLKTINKIKPGNRYRPTIAINGQIVGTWKRTFKKEAVLMEYNLFKALNRAENHALTQAELHYSEFLNMSIIPKRILF
ncbi:MAG: winged helix DNA-binding domain-containing protein [Methanobacterium sp.]